MKNLDLSFFKSMRLGCGTLQLRLETFNILNWTNFANPGSNNISNVRFNADGTVRDLNGVGVVTGTNNVGREYGERYARVGLRYSF